MFSVKKKSKQAVVAEPAGSIQQPSTTALKASPRVELSGLDITGRSQPSHIARGISSKIITKRQSSYISYTSAQPKAAETASVDNKFSLVEDTEIVLSSS